MKKSAYTFSSKFILILMLTLSIGVFAQPGFDDETDIDEPVAPINEWVLIIGTVGIGYALYQYRKRAIN
jgi:hypothetical protein